MALNHLKMTSIFVIYCCVPPAQAEEMTLMMSSGGYDSTRFLQRLTFHYTSVFTRWESSLCFNLIAAVKRGCAVGDAQQTYSPVPLHHLRWLQGSWFPVPGWRQFQVDIQSRWVTSVSSRKLTRCSSQFSLRSQTLHHVRGCFPLQGCANREVNLILAAGKHSM